MGQAIIRDVPETDAGPWLEEEFYCYVRVDSQPSRCADVRFMHKAQRIPMIGYTEEFSSRVQIRFERERVWVPYKLKSIRQVVDQVAMTWWTAIEVES